MSTTYKEQVFEGDQSPAKGFKFMVPEFSTIAGYVEHYGEEDALKVVNSAIAMRIRTKVKNDLGFIGLKPVEITERKTTLAAKYPDFIVFNDTDAAKWRPEVREVTPNQIMQKIKDLSADTTLSPEEKKAKMEALVLELSQVTVDYYA
jgi:hypothetical protein